MVAGGGPAAAAMGMADRGMAESRLHIVVGKGGVVRDERIHRQVLREMVDWTAEHGFGPQGLIPSPIRGPKGNREFLLWLRPGRNPIPTEELVAAALA